MFAWLQPRSQIRVWLIGCSQIIGRDFDGLAPAKFIIQTFMGFPEKTSQFQFSIWLQPSPLLKKYKIWKIIENINHSLAASSKVQVFVWNLETTSWKPVYSRWQSGCKQHIMESLVIDIFKSYPIMMCFLDTASKCEVVRMCCRGDWFSDGFEKFWFLDIFQNFPS